jgi:hypothetical protein
MPPIFDDIVEVITIAAILPYGTVLSDVSPHIMLSQMAIRTSRGCGFASGMPCPIIVADQRFPPRNVD